MVVLNRMIVRIRFGKSSKVGRKSPGKRRFAAGIGGLLTPAAVLAAAIALWGIAADMSWTGSFVIHAGLFSHWQVWMGAASALQLCAYLLNRYAKTGQTAAS
jgi:hypothetical protein